MAPKNFGDAESGQITPMRGAVPQLTGLLGFVRDGALSEGGVDDDVFDALFATEDFGDDF